MQKSGVRIQKSGVNNEADTLYMSIGEPHEAMSLDVGEGTIVRYDEESKDVVGVTFAGLRERFMKQLKEAV